MARHERRAAIEPMIGHIKSDYRMGRNHLAHATGDAIKRRVCTENSYADIMVTEAAKNRMRHDASGPLN